MELEHLGERGARWLSAGEQSVRTLWGATRAYVIARKNAGELNGLSTATVGSHLARFARAVDPDLPIAKLRRRHIDRWLATRTHLAPATLRSEISTVKTFTRWCFDHGWVKVDPCVSIRGPRAPRAVPRHLETGSIRAALDVADERARLVIVLMAQLGLRCMEVAALQHGDVHDGVLYVRGKGGHHRVLPCTEEVREAIDRYLAAYPASAGPLLRSYVHPNRGLSPRYVGMLVVAVFRAAGIKRAPRDGISAHPIRHTAANDLLDSGADLRSVQQILGHAKLSTTAIYLQRHQALGPLRDALEGRRYGEPPL